MTIETFDSSSAFFKVMQLRGLSTGIFKTSSEDEQLNGKCLVFRDDAPFRPQLGSNRLGIHGWCLRVICDSGFGVFGRDEGRIVDRVISNCLSMPNQ